MVECRRRKSTWATLALFYIELHFPYVPWDFCPVLSEELTENRFHAMLLPRQYTIEFRGETQSISNTQTHRQTYIQTYATRYCSHFIERTTNDFSLFRRINVTNLICSISSDDENYIFHFSVCHFSYTLAVASLRCEFFSTLYFT